MFNEKKKKKFAGQFQMRNIDIRISFLPFPLLFNLIFQIVPFSITLNSHVNPFIIVESILLKCVITANNSSCGKVMIS